MMRFGKRLLFFCRFVLWVSKIPISYRFPIQIACVDDLKMKSIAVHSDP